MILSGMSNHSIFSIINIQTIQNLPPMTVGKFLESSDFSVIGNLPDFTIVLCIQYIPINGKVESKLNFLYTIYRVKKENKILYIVVRAHEKT